MIEIKNIVFTKCNYNPLRVFACFINHLLPLKLKFASESFVALNDGKKSGVITVEKDSKSYTRFKITKLILEENSTNMGRELVNFVISRYRAMGAASFYVVIDENQADLIDIFKNELNFRACAHEYLYKINSINTSYTLNLNPFKKELTERISLFYNENINSFNRFLFSKQNYQLLNGCLKYIFYDDEQDKILGYFEVASKNNTDFYINFSIDFAYNIYLIDAIKFIYAKIRQRSKNFSLYIKVKDYFINSKELLAILNENDFEFISKSCILAKDYYKEIKDNGIFKSAKIIFNDPTMA